MRGDPKLGGVLRSLRSARKLTLAAVAGRVGCAESLISQAETGTRYVHQWLAEALDAAYGTGSTITALCRHANSGESGDNRVESSHNVVLVGIPQQGITVPVSRRQLLAALGIGALGGTMLGGLQQATARLAADEELLADLTQTLNGLKTAGRTLPPARLIDPLTGHVAVIDAVRRRAPGPLARDFTILQTRCAESLSWMAEESGDLGAALYWTDRVQQWASVAGWQAMASYTHVRRSMLAISYASDGLAAAEQALLALHTPGTPPRIRAMAAKQAAYGYALAQRPDASKRALEKTVEFFGCAARQGDEEGPVVGQHSVNDADLLAIYEATCQVYLGGGAVAIDALTPRMTVIGHGSQRTHTITGAKLAHAYANAGKPGLACDLILNVLDEVTTVDSQTTRSELRRVLPVLARWPGRNDVGEVRHRLDDLG